MLGINLTARLFQIVNFLILAGWIMLTIVALTPVSGDRDLVFLACHNLLDSACKFRRSGDAIEVRASEDGHWVVVEVADTGPGIPEGDVPHVLEELYRGENPRGAEGSGLGLALVRAVARHHGGSVAVRSREGEGTAFTLRLPLA